MSNMISREVNIARDGIVTKNELNRDEGKSSRSLSTGSRSTNSRGSSAGHQSRSSIDNGVGNDANNSSVRAKPLSHSPGNPLPQEKSVRFNEIHIRDYERTVGDNPSCSSGPPIAIGWEHGNTRILNINHYEESRQFRRKQGKLVLNRRNREALLAYWEVPVPAIVEAIRGTIRVKNQRRQTVTNLGKVEKIEEVFENATRKLKNALLLRRRTEGKAKGYQVPVHTRVAPTGTGALKLNGGRILEDFQTDEAPTEGKSEQEDLDIPTPGSIYWRLSSNDYGGSSASEIVYENEDTSASSLSGMTLGNSSTASALEMEKFYRELELEMFGDMELPSMVGQTLEVPGLDILEEDRMYYSDAISFAQRRMSDNFVIDDVTRAHGDEQLNKDARQYSSFEQHGAPAISRSLDRETPSFSSVSRQMNHATRFHNQNRETSYAPVYREASYADYPMSRSLECLDLNPPANIRPLVGHGELYYPPTNPPTNPPPFMTTPRQSLPNGMHSSQERRPRVQRDSPEVRHLPIQGHISPTQFMEGESADGPSVRPAMEAVVISEDMYEEDQISLFLGGGKPYGGQMYGLHHPPSQQFPPPIFHHR